MKPKPECRALSQLLNLSTHTQRSPLKINRGGELLKSEALASFTSTYARGAAGSSSEPPPDTPPFMEADVRMAATRRDVSPGDVAIKARRDATIVSVAVTTFKVDVNGQK